MTGVDIGRAPALAFTDSSRNAEPATDRRRLNLRWLACTVLTGLAGASLMGGALFIALDRQAEFAELATPPEVAEGMGGRGPAPKEDPLTASLDRVSSRQVIQETLVRRLSGKEFVEVVPYVRVTASLATERGRFAERIPSFDPIKIFSESGGGDDVRDAVASAENDEDALTVTYVALASAGGTAIELPPLDRSEVERTVRETARMQPDGRLSAMAPVTASLGGPLRAVDATPDLGHDFGDLFDGGEAAATTTVIAKRQATAASEAPVVPAGVTTEDVDIEVQAGDTLLSILVDHGASRAEALAMVAASEGGGNHALGIGDRLRITVASLPGEGERVRPVNVVRAEDDGRSLIMAFTRLGARPSAPPLANAALRRDRPAAPSRGRASVHDGLYETALGHDVPRDLADELVRMFAFDVDFQRTVSPGDMLELFYAESGEDRAAARPEILFAELTLRGETRRLYRFRAPDDGSVDFYDETGRSAKKFLMRKPLSGGTFRSGFGSRRHPILGYQRMHYGVDWSARTGSPIMAAGNGTIAEAQWRSGFGNHIVIRHANGYETSYSHMSRFGEGIKAGVRVRQGQVIGYVGSTGMSTGPHLHYEVTVNGRHVDPMGIRLPRGRTLEGRMLAAFEKERERIEALMNRAPVSTRVAAR